MADRLFSSDRFQPAPPKPGLGARFWVWTVLIVLLMVLLVSRSRIVPRNEPPTVPLDEPPAVPLYEPGTRLDFTKSGSTVYLGKGWHGPEADFQWSSEVGVVTFRLARVQPLRMRLLATTYYTKQKIVVRLNDRDIGQLEGNCEDLIPMELDLPADALRENNTLTLLLPEAQSPRGVGASDDPRTLGIGVAWMEFSPRE